MSSEKNRIALVTGSTAGIGFAIAEKLLRKNIDVIINGRTEQRVAAAIKQLVSQGATARMLHGVVADVSEASGAQRIVETFPSVDVLVNNFGIFEPKNFADITDQDFPPLLSAHARSRLWTGDFHLQRIGDANSRRCDPLRGFQDRAAGCCPRDGGTCGQHQCDGQFRSGWAHQIRRHEQDSQAFCRKGRFIRTGC